MEAFVEKISAFLLIIVLITSNVVAEKMPLKSKIGKGSGTLDAHNNTLKGDCKQDVPGFQRVIQYVYNNSSLQCYTQFFVGGQPPTGLRRQNNNLRFICQPPRPNQQAQNTYYATMFDEGFGIAVFAAYTLTQFNAVFPGNQHAAHWCPTPGIMRQGNDDLYRGQNLYQKGHLAPAHTFSNNRDRYVSTYTYTNAVPQLQAFNAGRWRRAENRIRRYAALCTQGANPGTLYVLTGTSFAFIRPGNPPQSVYNQPAVFPPNNPTIDIPKSLWSAGCCVRPNGGPTASFAVIGNNVQNANLRFTSAITVADLQQILTNDVTNIGVNINGPNGPQNVNLFPANAACSNPNNYVNLQF